MSSFLMEEIQNELDMANVEISKLKRRLDLTTKYKDDKKKEAEKYFNLNKSKDRQIEELQDQLKNAIVPKFKIGQEVFYLKDSGIIESGEILSIKLWNYKTVPLIYEIEYSDNIQGEEYVFATREEAEKRMAELKGDKKDD